ncbi:MAG: tRNA pseudouridine(13) synthase TruD [Candidatus Omnitrophica bacterium]|nr:tRNA pseudouridine(13) synthase TruD [Candidatus Omnitrophota bacterium]
MDMKIKVKAEDFVVNEIAKIDFKKNARFKVYLLTKKGFNTLDVLIKLAKRFKLDLKKFGYGGRKDRYALTTQYITIEDLKINQIKEKSFSLRYLGDTYRKMGPDLILANEFKIVIRSLRNYEIDQALERLNFIKKYGFPNYFDDQRFGSFSPAQGFFAEKVIKKEFSGALKIYLTAVHPEDKKQEKQRKKFFFENWKNWKACLLRAETDFEKKAFRTLLEEKNGFLKVLRMIPKEELSILFSSFQSYLWNNLVERLIKFYSPKLLSYKGNYWSYFFYDSEYVFNQLKDLNLALASQTTRMPDEFLENIYREILRERGLKPSSFNLRKFRKVYFKPVLRKVIVIPEIKDFSVSEDEVYKDRKSLTLHFILPRASYGTMFIKGLFAK